MEGVGERAVKVLGPGPERLGGAEGSSGKVQRGPFGRLSDLELHLEVGGRPGGGELRDQQHVQLLRAADVDPGAGRPVDVPDADHPDLVAVDALHLDPCFGQRGVVLRHAAHRHGQVFVDGGENALLRLGHHVPVQRPLDHYALPLRADGDLDQLHVRAQFVEAREQQMLSGVAAHELVTPLPIHRPVDLVPCREGVAGNAVQHPVAGTLDLGDRQPFQRPAVGLLSSPAGIERGPVQCDPLPLRRDDLRGELLQVGIGMIEADGHEEGTGIRQI